MNSNPTDQKPNTRPAIIFDIDGTLSDVDHRLHHITGEKKDWDAFYDACDQDPPRKDVCFIAAILGVANTGTALAHAVRNVPNPYGDRRLFQPFFCTGRVERVRAKTENWLGWHVGNLWAQAGSDYLLMRPDGVFTPDDDLKQGMLREIEQRGYHIKATFDDRQRVVDMWRKEGLTCFQVAQWEEHK